MEQTTDTNKGTQTQIAAPVGVVAGMPLYLPEGKLAIVLSYGVKQLSAHLHNMELLAMGVPYDALAIKEIKEKSQNKIVQIDNDRQSYKKDKIAVVNLNGLIQKEDGFCSYGTATKGEELLKMKDDVIGAVLKIDSGGGYMDGAESFIADMREFGKPIVALASFAGSAAYMIASEADQILATSEMAEFGSIGVYYELNSKFREVYKQLVQTAYSKKSPNKNAAFRQWIEENDLSGYVDAATDADEIFMNLVKKNRQLKEAKSETLSGGMFWAISHNKEYVDAQRRGLIDGLGDNTKAYSLVQKLARARN